MLLRSLWLVPQARYIMALRSCSVLGMLITVIIIIIEKYSEAKLLEESVNAYWVYSVENVSNMYLILSISIFVSFAMCERVACDQLTHPGHREDIFLPHLIIIIKSEMPAFSIVCIFPWLCVWGCCIVILSQLLHIHAGKVWFWGPFHLHYWWEVYN